MSKERSRFELVLDVAQIGTWDFDPRGREMNWSDSAKGFFGLSPARQITYDLFLSGLHPDDRDFVHAKIQDALNSRGGKYRIEFRTIGIEDKRLRTIAAAGRVEFNGRNEPIRLLGVSYDL